MVILWQNSLIFRWDMTEFPATERAQRQLQHTCQMSDDMWSKQICARVSVFGHWMHWWMISRPKLATHLRLSRFVFSLLFCVKQWDDGKFEMVVSHPTRWVCRPLRPLTDAWLLTVIDLNYALRVMQSSKSNINKYSEIVWLNLGKRSCMWTQETTLCCLMWLWVSMFK